jgi:two-component system response regulator MprA
MRAVRILVAEDNTKLAAALKQGLGREGYSVDVAANGLDAEALLRRFADGYAVVVLDIGLPGRDGFELCRSIRRAGITVPVLVVTARDSVGDRVTGLDAGADDYLVKPFALEELKARIRALLRRPRGASSAVLRQKRIALDPAALRVEGPAGEIRLTRKEFRLLELLMRHPGQVLSREQIVRKLWGIDADPGSNAVDVHVKNLRRKLIEAGSDDAIETVRGLGYRVGS